MVLGSNPVEDDYGSSVWSLHVLPVLAWASLYTSVPLTLKTCMLGNTPGVVVYLKLASS